MPEHRAGPSALAPLSWSQAPQPVEGRHGDPPLPGWSSQPRAAPTQTQGQRTAATPLASSKSARLGAHRCPAGMLPADAAKISAQQVAPEPSRVPILPTAPHGAPCLESHLSCPRAQPCSALRFPRTMQLPRARAEPSCSPCWAAPAADRGREQSWASPGTGIFPGTGETSPEPLRGAARKERSPRQASRWGRGSRRDRFALLYLGFVTLTGLQRHACSRRNQLPAPVAVFLGRLVTLHGGRPTAGHGTGTRFGWVARGPQPPRLSLPLGTPRAP